MFLKGGPLVPHSKSSSPQVLSFVAVLRLSVRITMRNQQRASEGDRIEGGRGKECKLVLFILTDVIGHCLAPRQTNWGGGGGCLAREGPAEGWGGGALPGRAAAGALLGADGL